MFGITFGTYLLSKEWFVIEHEFYSGCSLAVILIYATKKYGKSVGEFFDQMANEQEASLQEGRNNEIKMFEEQAEHFKKEIWRTESAAMIAEAKKESIKMQLEAEYRARLATVYNEVKLQKIEQILKIEIFFKFKS